MNELFFFLSFDDFMVNFSLDKDSVNLSYQLANSYLFDFV
jgi:hypothetical protein